MWGLEVTALERSSVVAVVRLLSFGEMTSGMEDAGRSETLLYWGDIYACSMILRNAGTHLPDHATLWPRSTQFVYSYNTRSVSLSLHVSFPNYVLGLGEMFCRRLLQFPSKHLTWHLLEHLFIPGLDISHLTCILLLKTFKFLKCTLLVYAEYVFRPTLVIFRRL
jgi:hypothetical protein